jgi:hypothetical protein
MYRLQSTTHTGTEATGLGQTQTDTHTYKARVSLNDRYPDVHQDRLVVAI